MRRPELRDPAVRWWAREAREGEIARADPGVQKAAERMGLGFGEARKPALQGESEIPEGQLKTSARMAVEGLKGALGHPVS